jgi:ParB-like chromosome segregation protein Spo0J
MLPSYDHKTNFEPGNARAVQNAKSPDLFMVLIDEIVVTPGLNVRVHNEAYEDRIEDLAASIMQNGFYKHQPLPAVIAKDANGNDVFKITGGFTRLAAAKRARDQGYPIEKLPIVIRAPGGSDLDIQIAIHRDNTGNPLPPWELGVIVKRLIGGGYNEAEIKEKLDISITHIKNLLLLHSLDMRIQELAMYNKVSATRIIRMAHKIPDQDELYEVLTTPRKRNSTGVTVRKAMAAITYGCSLPTGIVDFLTRWSKGDTEAMAEVDATLRKPRKPRVSKKKQLEDVDL